MKKTIICIDRDGTLVYDSKDHLFLGKDDGWESEVKLLPHVIDGLKALNKIPDSVIYMITNQSGVAISDFRLLTLERAHEVCRYVVSKIRNMGAHIDGYFLCPHATPDYVKTKPGMYFDKRFVHDNCGCLKPALGMVFNVLKVVDITLENADIYVVGDRATDVQTALNINGIGVLIPFENEPGEEEKVRKLADQAHVQINADLLKAAEWVIDRKKSRQEW